ncbi:unnamed protein product [Fusarium langsethiae]|nr:unnamed protein product [Fusarium langsethiae]GKU22934.1 unnamed protein product [Fusarium langsethiae]
MLIDDWNKSLLSAASQGGCVEIVKELLGRGLGKHVALPAKSGDTPLSTATQYGLTEIVTLLLSVPEASVNHANNYGVTPLFSAARFGHIETVKVLLSSPDIELDCKNWTCLTPLHAAVANGHAEIAKILIEKGATIIAWPAVGRDLLWWAQRIGNSDMVKLIRSNGLTEASLGPFRFLCRKAPTDDATTVVFNVELGYCDVCTLTVEDDKGYCCNKCWQEFWDEILICSEYFDREYNVCIN